MPAVPGTTNSPWGTASALDFDFGTLTFAGAGTQTTNTLPVDGLIGLRAWFLQTVGPGVVTVTLQFDQGNAAGNVINWQPLVAPFVLALNTPAPQAVSLPVTRFRASLTSTGVATVLWRTGAALT